MTEAAELCGQKQHRACRAGGEVASATPRSCSERHLSLGVWGMQQIWASFFLKGLALEDPWCIFLVKRFSSISCLETKQAWASSVLALNVWATSIPQILGLCGSDQKHSKSTKENSSMAQRLWDLWRSEKNETDEENQLGLNYRISWYHPQNGIEMDCVLWKWSRSFAHKEERIVSNSKYNTFQKF